MKIPGGRPGRRQEGRVLWYSLVFAGILAALFITYALFARLDTERLLRTNRVLPHAPFVISEKARELHESLLIGDWHADSLLWLRDLLERSDIGQVDIPRLREGNVALQAFFSVTKVPGTGIQLVNNADSGDQVRTLAFLDKWPEEARSSLLHRAIYHARKMQDLQARAPEQVKLILDRQGLAELVEARLGGKKQLGALLGVEGLHALEGDASNIARLYDAGFRIMGFFHFFDNELGGSLHGQSHAGLTDFGRRVVRELNERDMIIDLAHASEEVVRDVLAMSSDPVVVSHTGMRGVCDSARNIPDELMLEIAQRGGLIGIGYFEIAICEVTVESVVKHIRYAIDLLGVDHVSLGSDYDGTVDTPFDTSELAVLTEVMLQQGFSHHEIRAIMGENMRRFLERQLPKGFPREQS